MRIFLFHSILFSLFQTRVVAQTFDTLKTDLVTAQASQKMKEEVRVRYGRGLTLVAPDSSMSLQFRARFQTLFVTQKQLSARSTIEKEMMIRRFRLKFDGFAFTPKLEYKIELALSNRDIGPLTKQANSVVNIVLDAVLKYKLSEKSELWFGQTKLPGNRERVISSQNLQFVDRSLVNSHYNLDRDIGVQFHHRMKIGKVILKDAYAISLGQGRNITAADTGGFSYTGRLEILPFGEFTAKGDYSDADLEREQKPKLSIGAGFSYNDDASRENGELGPFLQETRDLKTFFTDAMVKYKGWSLTSEYMSKQSDRSPLLADGSGYFQTGNGWNIQSGYLFKNKLELSGRYTVVNPSTVIKTVGRDDKIKEYTLGVSKYFKGHSLKIQSDLSYVNDYQEPEAGLRYRLQLEMGF